MPTPASDEASLNIVVAIMCGAAAGVGVAAAAAGLAWLLGVEPGPVAVALGSAAGLVVTVFVLVRLTASSVASADRRRDGAC